MRQTRIGLLALVVPLLCCGFPLLVAVVLASGAGAWLAASRLVLGAVVALAISAIGLAFWIQQRRRLRKKGPGGVVSGRPNWLIALLERKD